LDLLSILDQYKDKKWTDIIEEIYIEEDIEISSLGSILEQNTFDMEEFASLKL
jgi:hypothetical protein